MKNGTWNTLQKIALFLFNNWMGYFYVITSVLLISFSLVLLYLPKDNLIYVINLFAQLFKEGKLRDINSVINTLYNSLKIIFVFGVGSFIMAVLIC
ncbi:MAG: hypothetical protein LUQ65_02835, partial [Candidatus Helarchaeota archaeon]|nr:hypothetical protein [Candidatus Helarchaeota archaeon]